MVTFRIDVAPLYAYVKEHHLSFYYSLVYLCTQAINEVDAFRYTIRGTQVFYLDPRIPSFTDLKKDSEYFHIVTMPTINSLAEFNAEARKAQCRSAVFPGYYSGNRPRNLLLLPALGRPYRSHK